jgi:hypothetical protein
MSKKDIKKHLADYKKNTLNISQNGIWKNNKKQYEHILPEILQDKNILNSDYHHKIIDAIATDHVNLHTGFHHLNSSQALCFNLFYPLLFEKELTIPLLKKLMPDNVEQNDNIKRYEFEYIEDTIEKTNFDLYLETNSTKYYLEIKYTEEGFGKAKRNASHEQKYNAIYKEKLSNFETDELEKDFFKNYQLFRNLIYMDGYNIFIFPKDRIDLKRTIKEVKTKYCSKAQQDHIIILHIEDIVESILAINNEKLSHHYNLFKEKYLPVII